MTPSNLDLARECGATFRSNRDGEIKQITMGPNRLDAFAERIRAEARPKSFAKMYLDNAEGIEQERLKMQAESIAAARPAVERKPLTDEQAVACIKLAGFTTWDTRMWALKQQIEAAHGITAQQGDGT